MRHPPAMPPSGVASAVVEGSPHSPILHVSHGGLHGVRWWPCISKDACHTHVCPGTPSMHGASHGQQHCQVCLVVVTTGNKPKLSNSCKFYGRGAKPSAGIRKVHAMRELYTHSNGSGFCQLLVALYCSNKMLPHGQQIPWAAFQGWQGAGCCCRWGHSSCVSLRYIRWTPCVPGLRTY